MNNSVNAVALLLTLLMVAACDKPAPEPSVATPRYEASEFFESVSYLLAGDSAWTADGRHVLIGSDESGIFNVWQLDTVTGEKSPLTASTVDSVFPVGYFPADDRILYTSDKGGNERFHLFVKDASDPESSAVDLTPGDDVRASFAGFSPDAQHFYVLTNERDPSAMDLYQYRAEDYSRTLIFRNEDSYDIADVYLPYVALVKVRTNADTNIYLADLNSRTPDGELVPPKLITAHVGDVAHFVHTFVPGGNALLYSSNESSEFDEAWQYDLKSGEKSKVVTASWNVEKVGYSLTGQYRYALINEDAAIKVELQSTATGDNVLLDLPEGTVRSLSFSADEKQLAMLITTDTSPADVFTAQLQNGEVKRWTTALNATIDEADLVEASVVRYQSFDGLQIPGILYRPRDASAASPVPALVWVHGGPGGQSMRGYRASIQHLVNNGYAIFAANNRGSSGYGKTFFHLDDLRHGEVDLDDIVYAKRYLTSLDWVDGGRIGIIGGSYGGYMVGAALAFRPEEFDVGINIFGVMNWVRTLKSIPAWWGPGRDGLFAELGDPATDEVRLRRISPLFHAANIQKPLLVVQGANDPRVLQVESDEIVAAVRANEVAVDYVLFDDEGHGFTKRANRVEASSAYLKFLDKHLGLSAGGD